MADHCRRFGCGRVLTCDVCVVCAAWLGLRCSDGSMAATLFAGGEWDAAFRAIPF